MILVTYYRSLCTSCRTFFSSPTSPPLALALDYPFTVEGLFKPGVFTVEGKIKHSTAGEEADSNVVVRNVADNTYFNHLTGMTTTGRPEDNVVVVVVVARAKS